MDVEDNLPQGTGDPNGLVCSPGRNGAHEVTPTGEKPGVCYLDTIEVDMTDQPTSPMRTPTSEGWRKRARRTGTSAAPDS